MIEELKDEELVRRVGGRFKLSALIQKRLVALNGGAPSVVDLEGKDNPKDKLGLVIQEILQGKIFLKAHDKSQRTDDTEIDALAEEFSNL
jgi:DNA-directed RNA polymerase subunit omega